ncbi:hypothetical protein GCM10018781_22990 [Kitasatospora indigofera]|uniref:Uncharacterized protein n=1 Tax=Kitasatospora indigofera TaxID=67307 RepID=A0A919FKA2_9ACTN|nr:hypothetical protein GCM10018781_22990 [Kitasatospora indigofera]
MGVGGERQGGQQGADLLLHPAEVGVVATDRQLHGAAPPAGLGGRPLLGSPYRGRAGRAASVPVPVPTVAAGALVTGMSGPSREG